MNNYTECHHKFDPCYYSTRLISKLVFINQTVTAKDQVDLIEIQKAIFYAREYHGEQKRESGEPYYSHPLEVAYMIADYATADNKQYFKTYLFVSAILHDTIEDTTLTEDMIQKVFGKAVANQVACLTRIKVHGKITSEELVNSLVIQGNKEVLMIKMFDRLHNVQTIKSKSPEKIKKIINETIRVFLFLSVYLDMPQIRNILIKFCYTHLDKKQHVFSLTDQRSVFVTDNYQLPSLKPQNDASLTSNLY